MKTKNTILLGDFNTNPFETNMLNANVLHAIPYKEEINNSSRVVSGNEYDKFYSPMWKLLGKSSPPYGTYYYNTSKITNYYWNLFDQVIIRPVVLKAFNEESLEIITKTKKQNLLDKNNRPDKEQYSDHLPLFFSIREELLT